MENKIQVFEEDIKVLKSAADAGAKKTEITEIKNRLLDYTTQEEFQGLQQDYSGFVKREEYHTLEK